MFLFNQFLLFAQSWHLILIFRLLKRLILYTCFHSLIILLQRLEFKINTVLIGKTFHSAVHLTHNQTILQHNKLRHLLKRAVYPEFSLRLQFYWKLKWLFGIRCYLFCFHFSKIFKFTFSKIILKKLTKSPIFKNKLPWKILTTLQIRYFDATN